jgi:tetratricopeptide (TPR) repeat protein
VVADLVRQIILFGAGPVAPGAIDDLGARALRRLLPDLLGPDEDEAGTANPAGELMALYDAIGGLLRLASSQRPIVVVIEDLHAATSDSARAVAALVEQRIPGVMFVLTHRLHEPGSSVIGELADVARTTGSFRSLRLGELAEEDLIELADGLPLGLDALEIGSELYRRTGGHPLFATSILESIARAGAASSGEHLHRSHIPHDIVEHIARRLGRLTPDAQDALEAAAVIGDELELDLWARVLQRPLDDSLVELVVEVEDSGLVADVAGRSGWLRFSHELVRDAVYRRLTALRRARLHRSVVEALGSSPELVAARAHHCYEAAGMYAELRPSSVDASIAAARDGIERMAYGDAVHHYRRALELVQTDARRALVGAGLGDALWREGDLVEARHQLERAAALARELGSVELLAEIVTTMSAVAYQSIASDARLRDLYEEVLALLPDGEVFWRVRLVTAVIRETAPGQISHELRSKVAPALDLAVNDADPATRAYAHLIRHDAQLGDLDSSRRARTAAQVIAAAEAARDPHLLCEGHGFALSAALEQADLEAAQDAIAGCERTAERFRSPYARWQAALHRAGLAIFQKPLAEARAAIDEAREIGASLAYREVEHMHSVQMALLRRELGRVISVDDIGPRDAAMYELTVWTASVAVGLCETRGGRQPERAIPLLDDIVRHGLDRMTPARSHPLTLGYLAEAFAYLRDRHGAGLVLPFAQASVRRHPIVVRAAIYCGSMDHRLGLLHATLGQYDAAIACFDAAYAIEMRMESPLWTCHTLVAHAQTLRARDEAGDGEAAAQLETRARTIADRYGYIRARQQLDGTTPPQIAAPARAATKT